MQKTIEIPDGCYVLTWTSERVNRLLMNNREVHLWSDFHSNLQTSPTRWISEYWVRISASDAQQLIFEWVTSGPFMKLEQDILRLPEKVISDLPEELQNLATWSKAANG